MSHVLDRFGGDRAWDLHCDAQDAAYERAISGATCIDDCDNCRIPDIHDARFKFMAVGFCPVIDDFVGEGDTPKKLDCQTFAGAAA